MPIGPRVAFGLVACIALLAPTQAVGQEHQLSFGGPGEAAGQLDFPAGVTVSPQTGHVFVAELDNDRISEFEPGGTFVKAFGLDVVPGGGTGPEACTAATGCQAASGTNAAGGVNAPSSIYAAPNGDLHLTELDAERISRFRPDGGFVQAQGWDVVPGGDPGFETCEAASGCKGGVTGAGAGQFFAPTGIYATAEGHVYVAENQNHRVTQIDPDGGFLRTFGFDVEPGGGTGFEICNDAAGMLGGCKAGVSGGGAGQFTSPRGVVADRAGRIDVVELGNRVSQFRLVGVRDFVPAQPPEFQASWGRDVVPGGPATFELCTPTTGCQSAGSGAGPGELSTPRGAIAAAPNGELLVADTGNDRINRYGPQGDFRGSFGEGVLDDPRGLAVDCRGGVWVGDGGASGLVHRFAAPGTPMPPCPLKVERPKRKPRNGTAKLTVQTPSAGSVKVGGRGVSGARRTITVAERVGLRLRAGDRLRRRLRENGRLVVRPKVVFNPGNGAPRVTKRVRVKLIYRP